MCTASELRSQGWARVPGITSSSELLELAKSLGNPIPSPKGDIICRLSPSDRHLGPKGTLTAQYGRSQFPLHTDTAFWPTPARFIAIRVYGDIRRTTSIRAFDEILQMPECPPVERVRKSVWRVIRGAKMFYCSCLFRTASGWGWRYDKSCMMPANATAQDFNMFMQSHMTGPAEDIIWSNKEAVVISNWTALHARGPEPQDEGHRVLERVYVR